MNILSSKHMHSAYITFAAIVITGGVVDLSARQALIPASSHSTVTTPPLGAVQGASIQLQAQIDKEFHEFFELANDFKAPHPLGLPRLSDPVIQQLEADCAKKLKTGTLTLPMLLEKIRILGQQDKGETPECIVYMRMYQVKIVQDALKAPQNLKNIKENIEEIKKFNLENNTDIIGSDGGYTNLHKVLLHDDLELFTKFIVSLFLQKNISLDLPTNIGSTPAHVAAGGNSRTLLEELLNAGSKLNIYDNTGWGMMHYAAAQGSVAMAHVLENGKGFNKEQYQEIITKSVALNKLAVVKFLIPLFISNKISVNKPAHDGTTPLQLAEKSGNLEVVKILHAAITEQAEYEIKAKAAAADIEIAQKKKPAEETTKKHAPITLPKSTPSVPPSSITTAPATPVPASTSEDAQAAQKKKAAEDAARLEKEKRDQEVAEKHAPITLPKPTPSVPPSSITTAPATPLPARTSDAQDAQKKKETEDDDWEKITEEPAPKKAAAFNEEDWILVEC